VLSHFFQQLKPLLLELGAAAFELLDVGCTERGIGVCQIRPDVQGTLTSPRRVFDPALSQWEREWGCRICPSLPAIEQMFQMSANIGFAATQVINLCLQLGGCERTPLIFEQGIQPFDLPLECIGDWPQAGMCIVTYALLRSARASKSRHLAGQIRGDLPRHVEPDPLIHQHGS
jgi:hypothetical protein